MPHIICLILYEMLHLATGFRQRAKRMKSQQMLVAGFRSSNIHRSQMAVSVVWLFPPLIVSAIKALGNHSIVVQFGVGCVVVHLDV